MKTGNLQKWHTAASVFVCLMLVISGSIRLHGQGNAGGLQGVVLDPRGQAVAGASVAIASATQVERTAVTNGEGTFTVQGLPAGTYTVEASATGFSIEVHHGVVIMAGETASVSLSLALASVSEEVTVEAEADTSLASQQAPVKALLDMASPRSEISSHYIRDYTSPVTDFADITQAAPGTVSYATNGVGNGQSKTWFRGFSDGAFTMTWDGVPFQDSNDPTHHSWAYVPAPAISYVDFDRSPGTASDIGPTNFAGSIHMFSPKMGDAMTMKFDESYGSFNTNQILGEFNSGLFGGKNPKANFWFEGHHNSSDGYQTFNDQQRTAGTAKFNYKFSDTSYLTIVSTIVLVDSNTPDSDPTRQQIADHGLNYVMDGNKLNPDGTYNSLYYRNYTYHVPTDFDVITYDREFGKGWKFETKPYSYSYSNHQHLQKKQDQDLQAPKPVYEPVTATSAVNKLNQYNRGGEITSLSQASRFGIFRIGAWYEYTTTHRFQIKTDPRTWTDSPLLKDQKFHEYFITNSAQPYVEYQLVAIPKWTLTAGVKSALYTMDLKQLADGSTVGSLGCTSKTSAGCADVFTRHSAFYNNILPSVEANYRIRDNWSVYAQYGRGSEIPPSNIFDVTGAQVAVTPKPTVATTYQGGSVVKLNHVSFDADIYHIHFENAYASYKVTNTSAPDFGDSYYYGTPASNTLGFEAEGNIYVNHGLNFNFNGTAGQAKFESFAGSTLANGTVLAPAPSQWVAGAPNYTVGAGATYQDKRFDLGFFNKQIGPRYVDNGTVHQATQLNSFWMNNLFMNYTITRGTFFDNSKIKLSLNNLFNFHDVVGLSPNASPTASAPFTPDPGDQLQLLPGRSVMVTFQLGLLPRER